MIVASSKLMSAKKGIDGGVWDDAIIPVRYCVVRSVSAGPSSYVLSLALSPTIKP